MRSTAIGILGLLVTLSLLNPAKADEILALGIPGGLVAWLVVHRYARKAWRWEVKERADVQRLIDANDALEARLKNLEGR